MYIDTPPCKMHTVHVWCISRGNARGSNEPATAEVALRAGVVPALLATGLQSYSARLQDAAAFALGNLCVESAQVHPRY